MKLYMTFALAASLSAMTLQAAPDGVDVIQSNNNNTLVRVSGDARYLMLPVEELMPDAKVNILADGNIAATINVRLAANDIDYKVPLDLTPYKGKNVVLSVVSPVDRGYSRAVADYVCWDELSLSDTLPTIPQEKYRPLFHHTPSYGWMNDPNGMFFDNGTWHLYYQYNPYGSRWQNMSWGHSTSTDLVNWRHEPVALTGDGLGAIFSGSCVIDRDNVAGFGKDAVIAFYTSADASQVQSLAYSTDGGETFTKYDRNPIVVTDREARDPKVFYHPESNKWIMMLAKALDHEMMIFSSDNLKDWTFESSFGRDYTNQDGIQWECPDLLRLPVRGTDKQKWLLICNVNPGGPFGGSATQYFIGDFDGHKFTSDTPANEIQWLDYGKDHYATVSWNDAPDGRNTVLGWMSNWQYANEVPTLQFRSANTLPRDLDIFRGPKGDYLVGVKPSPEVDAMRGEIVSSVDNTTVGATPVSFNLPKANDGVCEIVVSYDLKSNAALDLTLENAKGEKVAMKIDPRKGTFTMDRRESGLSKFSRNFPISTIAPLNAAKSKGTLRLFIDRSSIEAFDSEGRFAMTNLVFPSEPYTTLSLSSPDGKARIESLDVYSLNIK